MQDAWLSELVRVVRPGGLLVLSVQGDSAFEMVSEGWDPARVAARRTVLETDGFLYVTEDQVGSAFPDFYRTTFHATWYVFAHWAQRFRMRAYYPRGALSFQDVVVLEHPGPDGEGLSAPILPATSPVVAESPAPPPSPDRAGLQAIIDAGPPLGRPTRYGLLSRLVRRVVRRANNSANAHQQQIDRGLLAAVGDLERTVAGLDHGQLVIRGGVSQQSERLTRLEHQVSDKLEN
jgi:hypothetical protein